MKKLIILFIFYCCFSNAQMTKIDSATFYKVVKDPTMFIAFDYTSDSLRNILHWSPYGGDWRGIEQGLFYQRKDRGDTVFYEAGGTYNFRLKEQNAIDSINYIDFQSYPFKPRLYPFESVVLAEIHPNNLVVLYEVFSSYLETKKRSSRGLGKGVWIKNPNSIKDNPKDLEIPKKASPPLPNEFTLDRDSLMQIQFSTNAKFPDGNGKTQYIWFDSTTKDSIPIDKEYYLDKNPFKNYKNQIPFYEKYKYKGKEIFRIGRFNCYYAIPNMNSVVKLNSVPYHIKLDEKFIYNKNLPGFNLSAVSKNIRFPLFQSGSDNADKLYSSSYLSDVEHIYIVERLNKVEAKISKVKARRNECINLVDDSWELYEVYRLNYNFLNKN